MTHQAGIERIVPLSLILIHFVGLPAAGAFVRVPADAPALLVNAADVAINAPVPTDGANVSVSPLLGVATVTLPAGIILIAIPTALLAVKSKFPVCAPMQKSLTPDPTIKFPAVPTEPINPPAVPFL